MSSILLDVKVGLVSLGCPKNLVDSEVMLGLSQQAGHELTPDAAEADVLIVNTCAFIDSAKQESIDTILEMAQHKKNGACRRLIVTGCMAERYRDELKKEIPEIDAVLGTGQVPEIVGAIGAGAAGYLLKSEPPERIVAFLRGVAQGEAALSGVVARRLLDQVREGGGRRAVPDAVAAVLSARELEVLLLLDQHLGTDEIAARLFISEHTVRSHVKSLLSKLGVSSRREALEKLNHPS